MDRRSLLKGALGTLSATVGAFALRSGVDARESASAGVQGQSVTPPFPSMPLYNGHMSSFDELLPHHTHPLDITILPGHIGAPLQIVPGTSVTRTTYRQVTPFTTEQMAQLRDEHRALPHVFNAVVASGPKEGGMYTVRVISEVGSLGEICPITDAPAFLSEPL